ncbi:protein of unknown function [Ralstonia solanacearum PSI07]|nr:protein of unknown function [Ralstonia solanacearum PSI07]
MRSVQPCGVKCVARDRSVARGGCSIAQLLHSRDGVSPHSARARRVSTKSQTERFTPRAADRVPGLNVAAFNLGMAGARGGIGPRSDGPAPGGAWIQRRTPGNAMNGIFRMPASGLGIAPDGDGPHPRRDGGGSRSGRKLPIDSPEP